MPAAAKVCPGSRSKDRNNPFCPKKNNREVMYVAYRDLQQLLQNSTSSRAYFLSLPVSMQLRLHSMASQIHTAEQLHQTATMQAQWEHLAHLSGWEK